MWRSVGGCMGRVEKCVGVRRGMRCKGRCMEVCWGVEPQHLPIPFPTFLLTSPTLQHLPTPIPTFLTFPYTPTRFPTPPSTSPPIPPHTYLHLSSHSALPHISPHLLKVWQSYHVAKFLASATSFCSYA